MALSSEAPDDFWLPFDEDPPLPDEDGAGTFEDEPIPIRRGRSQRPGGKRLDETLEKFLADSTAEQPFLVDRLIPEGGLVAFVGFPESFKTSAMIQLGLAAAGGAPSLLDRSVLMGHPFIYLSNEKSRKSVQAKFRVLVTGQPPIEPVHLLHRKGIVFGGPRWESLRALLADLGQPAVVAIDTIASVAGPGFDENSGRAMSLVLGSCQGLIADFGATVLLGHHPDKHGTGSGGIRLRGHGSLWGEVDSTLEFRRPSRSIPKGHIRAEPKDGDLQVISFSFDPATFMLRVDAQPRGVTPEQIAEAVLATYQGVALTAEDIRAAVGHPGRTAFAEKLEEACRVGFVVINGHGRATRYRPRPEAGA